MKNLIERGHESVLEHVSITVKFICDRGVSHEIVRHRIASYSQESTRYCNYGDDGIAVIEPCGLSKESHAHNDWLNACRNAEDRYIMMLFWGCTPQEARAVLPNSLKTELVMTANLREWRHFLKLRCSGSAHPQMREVANMVLEQFKNAIPVIFDDIEATAAVQDRGSGSRSVQD